MARKLFMLLILLSLLLAVKIAYSSSIAYSDIIEVKYVNKSSGNYQNTTSKNNTVVLAANKEELPESVRQALMDYLEERQAVKTGSPYKKVFQVSLVLSSLVLLIFLFLEARHIRRVSIRHLLYYNIARLQEKGMDYEAIIEELSKRGWEPYRVNDAAHRYKKKYSGDKAQIPPHFSLDKNNPIFTVRRSLRRNYLYFLILKMAKKGMKIEEIKSNLMQKGWSEVHVSDAFHKYTKHIEKTEAEPVSFMNVSFLEKIGIYRHLRRNIRRLRLYYTMHKMLGKGMDFESISKELVGRGWKQRHIEDAVYRFREHLKR